MGKKNLGNVSLPVVLNLDAPTNSVAASIAEIGNAMALNRSDSRTSPFRRQSNARVPPVVGHGRPVSAENNEGGAVCWLSQNTFQAR